MPTYKAPVDDVMFLLNDVLHVERYNNLPGFAEATPDVVEAVLAEAGKFCEEVLRPLNRVGDREGCRRHADGSVTTPTGFKDAYKKFVEGGWIGASAPAEFGGQGLPTVLGQAVTRVSLLGQHGVRHVSRPRQGRDRRHFVHGSPSRRRSICQARRRPMDRHHEPDRAALRHRSRPDRDQGGASGRRLLRDHRQKIFISAGEHDLAENIVHLVLARIEGAPAGTKGMSLFVVPKIPARRRRRARRAQRGLLRLDRSARWASTATPPA